MPPQSPFQVNLKDGGINVLLRLLSNFSWEGCPSIFTAPIVFLASYFSSFYLFFLPVCLWWTPPPAIDWLTCPRSNLPVYWQLHMLYRERHRDIIFYYVPHVNTLMVVQPLLFNVGLLMPLFCKSAPGWCDIIQYHICVNHFKRHFTRIINSKPPPQMAHLLLKWNSWWKNPKCKLHFLGRQ